MFSVNTNVGQMIALQAMQSNQQQLAVIRDRLSSGLAVASPKDNGAVFAMAQNMRGLAKAYETLTQANDRTLGLLDTSISASESISDTLIEMKKLALSASDSSLSTADRANLNAQFLALRRQIDFIAGAATYDGKNLIDSSASNFVQYGPGAVPSGTNVVEWGSTPRTTGQPSAGEPLNLRFGFDGFGPQAEQIGGTVDFKLRYFDGTWQTVPLASVTIPDTPPPEVGTGNAPYVVEAQATMPDIPDSATTIQIFADYQGKLPDPDGQTLSEVASHGAPSGSNVAEKVPHLLLQWSEGHWVADAGSPAGFAATDNTVTGDTQPEVLVGGGPGTRQGTVQGDLTLTADPGIANAGIDYTVSYQVHDDALDQWTTLATSGTQTVGPGAIAGPVDLPYSIDVPTPPGGAQNFTRARLVLDTTTHHDGTALPEPSTVAGANSTATTANVSLSDSDVTFPEAVGQPSAAGVTNASVKFKSDLKVQSSIPSETYQAQARYVLRWFDGASWNETPFGPTLSSGNVSSASAVNWNGTNINLPSIAGPMQQAQIVARVQVTHDPSGTPSVETYDVPALNWDGASMTDHSASIVVAEADHSSFLYRGVRQAESNAKVDVLGGIDGRNNAVRKKNATTSGVAGLYLQTAALDTQAGALDAVERVEAAQQRMLTQTQYYTSQYRAISVVNAFENKLKDQLATGIGHLVDADMAQEDVKLTKAETRQKLATQSLAISNAFPKMILPLFRQ